MAEYQPCKKLETFVLTECQYALGIIKISCRLDTYRFHVQPSSKTPIDNKFPYSRLTNNSSNNQYHKKCDKENSREDRKY